MKIVQPTRGEVLVVFRLVDGKIGNWEAFMKQVFGAKMIVTARFYDTAQKILEAARGV